MQPSIFDLQTQFWTVAGITRHLKERIENDSDLQDCWVQGEVSNLSRPASGHIYFTLKDASAQLRCVMWRTQASRQRVALLDGQQIEVHGSLTVYEAGGQYQLITDIVRIAGEGLLYQEFLRRKAILEAEGLFDVERKRPLPARPARIGVITSPTGAALQDILNTVSRRYPLVEVIISPTVVQGEDAPASILLAFKRLFQLPHPPDVILLARGGGSLEDLWAFNDFAVVRQVAASPIPVVTGVGHETDFTLADFASDLRAPTPTAAAELATPDQWDLRAYTAGLRLRMKKEFTELVLDQQQQFQYLRHQLERRSPQNQIQSGRMTVENLAHQIDQAIYYYADHKRNTLMGLSAKLQAVNPLGILKRGYSLVMFPATGELVRSVHQITQGDQLDVRVSDGTFRVETQ